MSKSINDLPNGGRRIRTYKPKPELKLAHPRDGQMAPKKCIPRGGLSGINARQVEDITTGLRAIDESKHHSRISAGFKPTTTGFTRLSRTMELT